MPMADFRPVRRAQMISPFGVGAMLNFPNDEALMTAGLDVWPFAYEQCPSEWLVTEERLQKRLEVSHFRFPPDFRDEDVDDKYVRKYIPFVRFPRWHVCPAYGCGVMTKKPLFGSGVPKCLSKKHKDLPENRRPRMVPVRFVAVCEHGHIEDFPFMEWVHNGEDIANPEDHSLKYSAGRSASLSGITISCSCTKKRNLGGAFSYDQETGGALHKIGYDCKAGQPWLGISEDDGGVCGEYLRAVQRGGANVYFPSTFSSIYLPLWGEQTDPDIIKVLEEPKVWKNLSGGLVEGTSIDKTRIDTIAGMRGLEDKVDEFYEAAQRKLEGVEAEEGSEEEDYRRSEYEAFRDERGSSDTDLFVEALSIEEYQNWLSPFLEKICLVRKLRETRVLSGFSRLVPPGSDEGAGTLQQLSRNKALGWLPAMVVRGEGIFFEFKHDVIERWASKKEVVARIEILDDMHNQARNQRGQVPVSITPKFVLIHTFAHLLIRQLSYDCGYGSASLRERIYCDRDPEGSPMQGVLIYTAAGDAEGTMGGLVRTGEPGNIEESIRKAILSAAWCSSDPICIESKGQGSDNSNLAACHGCALLPETSCEEGNRLLDRSVVSGLPRNPSLGFFNGIVDLKR